MGMRVVVPAVGWAETGVIRQWHKEDGDWINASAPLCSVQLGEYTHLVTALDSGFLRLGPRIRPVGAVVKRGELLGTILAPGEPVEAVVTAIPSRPKRATRPSDVSAALMTTAATTNPHRQRVSPRARRAARDAGVRWTRLHGSGRGGRIIARDVKAAARVRPASAVHGESHRIVASATFALFNDQRESDRVTAINQFLARVFDVLVLLVSKRSTEPEEVVFGFAAANGIRYVGSPPIEESITAATIEQLRRDQHEKSPILDAKWLILDVATCGVESLVMPLPAAYHGALVIGSYQDNLCLTLIADQRHVPIADVLGILQAIRSASLL